MCVPDEFRQVKVKLCGVQIAVSPNFRTTRPKGHKGTVTWSAKISQWCSTTRTCPAARRKVTVLPAFSGNADVGRITCEAPLSAMATDFISLAGTKTRAGFRKTRLPHMSRSTLKCVSLKALRLTGDHQKCFRKILKFFSSIFCLRFSVEKEWVFCCFQLGKNGFRGLRVSLRVFFGAVKLMKF